MNLMPNERENFAADLPLNRANLFIAENLHKVNNRYKNTYHANCPVGWMNDSNGVCHAFGKYHLYFQYHPYRPVWGPMHWGHLISEDMVNWQFEGAAIAPDSPFDIGGCFSGSALFFENRLYVMYTGIFEDRQEQILAVSEDGCRFEKLGIVIDSASLPAEAIRNQFRDPRLFVRDGRFYCLVGSKSEKAGMVLLYTSEDMRAWQFVNVIYRDYANKNVCECPDVMFIDGKTVLIYGGEFDSGKFVHQNSFSAMYVIGDLDLESGKFTVDYTGELDKGSDFYGAQILHDKDGYTLFSWMGGWRHRYYTEKDGWQGSCIFPRRLRLIGNKLIQSPVPQLEKYRTDAVQLENVKINGRLQIENIDSSPGELNLLLDVSNGGEISVELFKEEDVCTTLKYDGAAETLSLYSEQNKRLNLYGTDANDYVRRCKAETVNGLLELRILIDRSSAEVFVNGGAEVMSMLVYPSGKQTGLEFVSDSAMLIRRLRYYKIGV